MDQNLRVILLMEQKKEKACFSGAMERFMMDNGIMVKRMVVECGKVLKAIHILGSGKMVK